MHEPKFRQNRDEWKRYGRVDFLFSAFTEIVKTSWTSSSVDWLEDDSGTVEVINLNWSRWEFLLARRSSIRFYYDSPWRACSQSVPKVKMTELMDWFVSGMQLTMHECNTLTLAVPDISVKIMIMVMSSWSLLYGSARHFAPDRLIADVTWNFL